MADSKRRRIGAVALARPSAPGRPASGAGLRIGFQKTSFPVAARQKGLVEQALSGQSVAIDWVEFPTGATLVEAMKSGAIHLGWTHDSPPIFGQAAGAPVVYVAVLPPQGSGAMVSYFLANRDFAPQNAAVIAGTLAALKAAVPDQIAC